MGNRAAVLSLIVRMPTGGKPYTPNGYTGIAIASSLVTLGKYFFSICGMYTLRVRGSLGELWGSNVFSENTLCQNGIGGGKPIM